MSRVLLFGGGGQVGTALRALLNNTMLAPAHRDFDIVTGDLEQLFGEADPQIVINCAAFHNTDQCERDPATAFMVNAVAVDRLASLCARRSKTFVTISSDYVFSGDARTAYREADIAQPRTTYGTSKRAGELLALRRGTTTLVIRLSGVFGTIGSSSKGIPLLERTLEQAERGEPTRMVDDITFSPSYAPHVARAIFDLIDVGATGIHHVTNAGMCTWYEFVRTAFAKAGLSDAPLEATTYAALGNPTQRPMFSPLENTTFGALGIAPLPPWQDALDEFLAARSARLLSAQ